MGKVLFFDIDGTLIPFKKKMPESTKRALKKAQENGHKIVICSGRSRSQMQDAILEVGFDGYVLDSGSYVEDQGNVIFRHIIENEELAFLMRELEMIGALYTCQTAEGVISTPRCSAGITRFFRKNGLLDEEAQKLMGTSESEKSILNRHDIEKFVYHNAAITVDELRLRIGERFELTGLSFEKVDPFSGEITAKGIHKASGMEKYLTHYGLTREDAIAFGDGPNDFEMIAYAGIGVVMGNGIDALKERADYITASVDEDGIEKALIHFGLI